MRNLFIFFSLFLTCLLRSQVGWAPISNFGTNPGNLNMYRYTPSAVNAGAALVIVMHGCSQNATTYATQSGWNKLADAHKFFVVYPEQKVSNNLNSCFNWFQSGDQDRGQGEALSIKQMVDFMKLNHTIDTTKIFITGLSAGACMTNVMLACYPDIFNKGAIMAGAPYKAATNAISASNVLYGFVTNTPQAWGNLVKAQLPSFTGQYPKVAVFHGSSDLVVSPINVNEIVKQWTNVHATDQLADATMNSFNGNSAVKKNSYNDNSGYEVVQTYTISNMSHGIAVDTGSCYQKGGQTGLYSYNINAFHSSFWAAYFFNILIPTYTVIGSPNVSINQSGVSYSVTNSATSYTWTVPSGASIISGQGTNQITVSFGSMSGNVSVTETNSSNCKIGPVNLYVNVNLATSFNEISDNNLFSIFPNPTNGAITIKSDKKLKLVLVTNLLGEIIFMKHSTNNSEYIDLVNFLNGVYFIHAADENGNCINKKIIKN